MRIITCLLLAGFLLGSSFPALPQIANYSVGRQKWFSQVSTNPVPMVYRYAAKALGANLQMAEARSPLCTNALAGGTMELTYGTNFPALTFSGTNQVSGLSAFNAAYPTGPYALYGEYKLVSTRSQLFSSTLTNDFPALDPIFTNLPPSMSLSATQLFRWPVFTSDTTSFVRFYLLEGDVETNLVDTLINGGIEAVTNNLSVLAWYRNLSPLQNQVIVTNLNPLLGHVGMLEFHQPTAASPTLPPGEISSLAANVTFFFGLKLLSQPLDQTVEEGRVAAFSVLAVGAQPLTYQWRFNGNSLVNATNLYYFITNVASYHAGAYSVVVSSPAGSETSHVAMLTVTNTGVPTSLYLDDFGATTYSPSSNAVYFRLVSPAGATNLIEATTNLTQWDVIGTLVTPLGSEYFCDTNALLNYRQRFYRAKKL
jgi:hypothetical protein